MIRLFIAPSGYGKSKALQEVEDAEPDAIWLRQVDLEKNAFESYLKQKLAPILGDVKIQSPLGWIEAFTSAPPFHMIVDHWEKQSNEIQSFWQSLLENWPQQVSLTLASTVIPNLPLGSLLNQGQVQIINEQELALTQDQAKNLWPQEIPWDTESETFHTECKGWPLGWVLYCQYRQGKISEAIYKMQIKNALQALLRSYKEPLFDGSWASQHWIETLENLPSLWKSDVLIQSQLSPNLWFHKGLKSRSVKTRFLFFQRANQCQPNPDSSVNLSILTRLAHAASLQGKWAILDQTLSQAQKAYPKGQISDQAAFHYLQANRFRQMCLYAEVTKEVNALQSLQSKDPVVMDFQNRSYILEGLSAYQQGAYTETQKSYESALVLAREDQNTPMILEVSLMLSFLDALQGKATSIPEDIESQISDCPLGTQPLMWLNLAFFWLLGESLNLEKGHHLLKLAEASAQTLEWSFLTPLIADISARLHRFHHNNEKALQEHFQALDNLPPDTFEYLHAQLNQALTWIKTQKIEEAKAQLEFVILSCKKNGSLTLLREATLALEGISHTPSIVSQKPLIENTSPYPQLRIEMFGGFQIYRENELIAHWPRKKARHLLAYLLLHPRGSHRETVAHWLSGQDDPAQSLRQLDVHVHSLRKVLEPQRKGKARSQFIHFQSSAYFFNWDSNYSWDIQIFENAYHIWKKGEKSRQACIEALELYRGPLLPELDFADFWEAERLSYENKALELLIWALKEDIEAKAYTDAEHWLERLYKVNPTHAQGSKMALELAFSQKDKAKLTQTYENIEKRYLEHLELAPEFEMEALYQRYLSQL